MTRYGTIYPPHDTDVTYTLMEGGASVRVTARPLPDLMSQLTIVPDGAQPRSILESFVCDTLSPSKENPKRALSLYAETLAIIAVSDIKHGGKRFVTVLFDSSEKPIISFRHEIRPSNGVEVVSSTLWTMARNNLGLI